MDLATVTPGPPLDRFVDSLIYYVDYNPDHSIERVIPDGHVYLVFELDGRSRSTYDSESMEVTGTFENAWVSGAQSRYLTIEACRESSMFVVRFTPDGAGLILPQAVDRFTDRVIPAVSIFGPGVLRGRAEIRDASSAKEAMAAAEQWLRTAMREDAWPPAAVSDAVAGIVADPGFARTNLGELVDASGYSRKQFIHLFKRYVGLAPKTFQRIVRFQEILPHIVARTQVSWPDISVACGYYDQSHFIREFKAFSGYNPQEFLSGSRGGRSNFFPVA